MNDETKKLSDDINAAQKAIEQGDVEFEVGTALMYRATLVMIYDEMVSIRKTLESNHAPAVVLDPLPERPRKTTPTIVSRAQIVERLKRLRDQLEDNSFAQTRVVECIDDIDAFML